MYPLYQSFAEFCRIMQNLCEYGGESKWGFAREALWITPF